MMPLSYGKNIWLLGMNIWLLLNAALVSAGYSVVVKILAVELCFAKTEYDLSHWDSALVS